MDKLTNEEHKALEIVYPIFESIYSIDMDRVIPKEKINVGLKNLDVFELMQLDESVRRHFGCTKHYTNVLKYNLREILKKDEDAIKTSDVLEVYGQIVSDFKGRDIAYLFSDILTFIGFCRLFDVH